MSFDLAPQRASESESYESLISITGNGTGNPTVNFGKNVRTVVRTSIGLITITFQDPPGKLIDVGGPSFQDATPANLKNFSGVFGSLGTDANGRTTLPISIYNAAGALTDLTSTNIASFSVIFKRAGVPG